jgi:hypothetical protein
MLDVDVESMNMEVRCQMKMQRLDIMCRCGGWMLNADVDVDAS